ncbi:hypothetical protein DKP78_26960, partial [Enterococcus faecium]
SADAGGQRRHHRLTQVQGAAVRGVGVQDAQCRLPCLFSDDRLQLPLHLCPVELLQIAQLADY